MKMILPLLLIFPLLVGCSSDDEKEQTQDYTSFVVKINSNSLFNDCVAGYKLDGNYKKLGDLGNLKEGVISPEIRVPDNNITEIYIFADLGGVTGIVKADAVYKIDKYKKNTIIVLNGTKGIQVTDKTDPTQYPQ